MTLAWIRASESLPEEGETVLLHLPAYLYPRPALATLRRGDPNHAGEYYRRDKWVCEALLSVSGVQYVKPEQLWARIPTPPGVDAWANPRSWTPDAEDDAEGEGEDQPVELPARPPHDTRQPRLFGGQQ